MQFGGCQRSKFCQKSICSSGTTIHKICNLYYYHFSFGSLLLLLLLLPKWMKCFHYFHWMCVHLNSQHAGLAITMKTEILDSHKLKINTNKWLPLIWNACVFVWYLAWDWIESVIELKKRHKRNTTRMRTSKNSSHGFDDSTLWMWLCVKVQKRSHCLWKDSHVKHYHLLLPSSKAQTQVIPFHIEN